MILHEVNENVRAKVPCTHHRPCKLHPLTYGSILNPLKVYNLPEMGCSLEVTGSEQRAGWSAVVDDCGNRALSANDDTSEMIWGTDIKRVRVQQRALRNGEKGRGDCPLGDCSD